MKSSFLLKLTKPNLFQRILKKIDSLFFLNQWIVLIAPDIHYQSLDWENFTPLIPPLDRFWADPFILFRDNKYHIFIEELIYSTHRGHINCITLDKDLKVQANQVVLERPYHLSYPFLLEHAGELYMIPETSENNGIELYRCKHFPDQWEFVKTLIKNVSAVDSTLIQTKGKWWLFANIKNEAGSTWDTLHLYYADSPLSDHWLSHPLNPIVNDRNSARPAGHIFVDHGNLIRPSQDCSVRYGYAINFNRISTLTETDYSETCEQTFKPPLNGTVLATHTFNSLAGLTAIDAIRRRPKH